MKKLVVLLLGMGCLPLAAATTGGFRIKNDDQNNDNIYVALAVDNGYLRLKEAARGLGYQSIEPGDSKHQPINLNESTYVAIWKSPSGLNTLSIIPTTGSRKTFSVTPTALYTFRKGEPIDVVWTGKTLEPRSLFAKAKGFLKKGKIKKINFIP